MKAFVVRHEAIVGLTKRAFRILGPWYVFQLAVFGFSSPQEGNSSALSRGMAKQMKKFLKKQREKAAAEEAERKASG